MSLAEFKPLSLLLGISLAACSLRDAGPTPTLTSEAQPVASPTTISEPDLFNPCLDITSITLEEFGKLPVSLQPWPKDGSILIGSSENIFYEITHGENYEPVIKAKTSNPGYSSYFSNVETIPITHPDGLEAGKVSITALGYIGPNGPALEGLVLTAICEEGAGEDENYDEAYAFIPFILQATPEAQG